MWAAVSELWAPHFTIYPTFSVPKYAREGRRYGKGGVGFNDRGRCSTNPIVVYHPMGTPYHILLRKVGIMAVVCTLTDMLGKHRRWGYLETNLFSGVNPICSQLRNLSCWGRCGTCALMSKVEGIGYAWRSI